MHSCSAKGTHVPAAGIFERIMALGWLCLQLGHEGALGVVPVGRSIYASVLLCRLLACRECGHCLACCRCFLHVCCTPQQLPACICYPCNNLSPWVVPWGPVDRTSRCATRGTILVQSGVSVSLQQAVGLRDAACWRIGICKHAGTCVWACPNMS